MRWFGNAWGAPVCAESRQVATPVGVGCGGCDGAIGTEDQGVLMPYIGAPLDELKVVRRPELAVVACTRCGVVAPSPQSDCALGAEVPGAGTEPHVFEDKVGDLVANETWLAYHLDCFLRNVIPDYHPSTQRRKEIRS